MTTGNARIILGIDAGFTSMGWAAAEISGDGPQLVDVGILRTKPGEAKLLKTEDNAERSRHLFNGLVEIGNRYKLVGIAMEAQSWPRVPDGKGGMMVNPATCGVLGMAFGLIFAFAALWELPLMQQTPQRIKKLTTGFNNGKKDAVRAGLMQMRGFGELEAMLHAAGIPQSYWEHPVDAAAAIYAALDTDQGRLLRSLAA